MCLKTAASELDLQYVFMVMFIAPDKRVIQIILFLFLTKNVSCGHEGSAKSFVSGFGLLQCYVLSNIFLLQTFKVFPLY